MQDHTFENLLLISVTASMTSAGKGSSSSPNSARTACQSGSIDSRGLVDLINDLEDVALPPLTDGDIGTFVTEMLNGRDIPFDDDVVQRLIDRLGRPIPLFRQMAAQDLYRNAGRHSTG